MNTLLNIALLTLGFTIASPTYAENTMLPAGESAEEQNVQLLELINKDKCERYAMIVFPDFLMEMSTAGHAQIPCNLGESSTQKPLSQSEY